MPGWARILITITAVASVPVTVLANYLGSYFTADSFGIIGASYSSSSSSSSSSLGLLVVGSGNYFSSGNAHNSMVVGASCNLYDSNSVVFGKWNANTGGDEAFVIGNGSYGAPANSFVVLKNGTIRINRQGDIEMGIYGN